MYAGVTSRHAEVREEGEDRNRLAPVEVFLSDHHPDSGHLLGDLT